VSAAAGAIGAQAFLSRSLDGRIANWVQAHPQAIYEGVNTYAVSLNMPKTGDLKARVGELTKATPLALGAPVERASVVIVEFFDFNCVHCRAMEPLFEKLLKDRPYLALVPRDLPILGESSLTAAKVARAAALQGHYAAVRAALFAPPPTGYDENALRALCDRVGADFDRLKKDALSPAVSQAIDEDLALGKSLKVTGTPFIYLWSPSRREGVAVSGEFTSEDINTKLDALLD
jgi:protein-disulfide isomerase